MSVEARIAKLESLLGRVQSRRRSLDELGAASAEEAPLRAVSPTPMEAALEAVEEPEIEIDESIDDEPELEIVMDADDEDEPIITVLPPGGNEELDEPELLLDDTPTAPVSTRAPVQASPSIPERIEATPARASSPVSKVVSQARPRTFGELLDRTLALRPR